ncbi:SWIM zinc finger domain-containing protein [Paenibacillus sp. sgz500958]|uniref:SWIM zinc finger family protein n=1 Tax=Paenibacillus sp. sgz500958 TaxID=3242475 RepID=UPI0036D42750
MKSLYTLDDAQWSALLQDAAYYFDDLTLKRGFQYYKQGRVLQFSMSAPPIMEAVVEGREKYSVQLNLDAFSLSYCSCPVQGHCKHMAAVLLHFAEWQRRSLPMLVNAKSAALSLTSGKPQTLADSPASVQKSQALASLKEEATRIPSMNIAEWHEWFGRCLAPLSQQTRNPQYVDNALALIFKTKPPLSPAAEQIFRLHSQLYVLEMLLHPSRNQKNTFGFSSLGYYTHLAVSELLQTVAQGFTHPLPLDREPEQWSRLSETTTYLRNEMLTEAREVACFSVCYDLLFRHWIIPNSTGRSPYIEELEQLRIAEVQLGTALSRSAWLLAQSRMHFTLGEDEAAIDLLKDCAERSDFRPEELTSYLETLNEAKDWRRLTSWLVLTGPLLTRRRSYKLESYSLYWEKAIQECPDAEPQMWNTLLEMLPLSREIYQEKLLARGKWQEWMDYQLSSGKVPAHFRVSELQPLEKNAPETLLPFYHQAVERFVAEKNRSSYKAAVKLLKRLKKLYAKMKQEARWEAFFQQFMVRHSRLRALQEELRKGKLTDE